MDKNIVVMTYNIQQVFYINTPMQNMKNPVIAKMILKGVNRIFKEINAQIQILTQ